MNDKQILSEITRLVDEEHALLRQEAAGESPDPNNDRMKDLEEMLDQCWDLLRQRRARREFGLNPDEAETRSKATVEGYLQ